MTIDLVNSNLVDIEISADGKKGRIVTADVSGHDLVRNFGGPKPTITVLCGSTRFGDAFRDANLRLTLAGHIVLTVGCDMRSDNELWADPVEAKRIKRDLDELHKRKIDLADEVLVLNVGGYIGKSTSAEITYAKRLSKPVTYLEPAKTVHDQRDHDEWKRVALHKWQHYRDNVYPSNNDVAQNLHAHNLAKIIPYLLGMPEEALEPEGRSAVGSGEERPR